MVHTRYEFETRYFHVVMQYKIDEVKAIYNISKIKTWHVQ